MRFYVDNNSFIFKWWTCKTLVITLLIYAMSQIIILEINLRRIHDLKKSKHHFLKSKSTKNVTAIQSNQILLKRNQSSINQIGKNCSLKNFEVYKILIQKIDKLLLYKKIPDVKVLFSDEEWPTPCKNFEKDEDHVKIWIQRHLHSKNACKLLDHPLKMFDWYWGVVDDTHRLSYACRNAKAASTTILSLMVQLNGKNVNHLKVIRIHETVYNHFLRPPTMEEFLRRTKDYFSFTVVRHPIKRLISTYVNKVLENYLPMFMFTFPNMVKLEDQNYFQTRLRKYHYFVKTKLRNRAHVQNSILRFPCTHFIPSARRPLSRPVPKWQKKHKVNVTIPYFREFALFAALTTLESRAGMGTLVNEHFLSQADRCNPCQVSFDAIFKVETLNEDYVLMKKILHLPSIQNEFSSNLSDVATKLEETPNILKINPSRMKPSIQTFLHELNSEELNLIYTAYYQDFIMFGYDPCEDLN